MATGQIDRLNGLVGSLGIKAPVRAATTANITLSGLQTLDGVALAAWDRALVKDQTDGTQNGVYDVQTGAWTRSPDFDGNRDNVKGTAVNVNEGTINALTQWQVTASDPVVVGTTAITFTAAQYSGLSLATVYNTLERLVELRAVDKIVINEERAQYDLARTPHHHFFCTTCNALIDIEVTCPHAKTWVAGPHKIDEVHGYFKGTCANCLKNNKFHGYTLS